MYLHQERSNHLNVKIYKYTDKGGVTHVTRSPPHDNHARNMKLFYLSYVNY